MKTSDYTPRPTEYCGVVFRSKCEAIFARNLDLRGFSQWNYEPQISPGWNPDFWAIQKMKTMQRGFLSWIIEYKPESATETYKNETAKRFSEVCGEISNLGCVICCGSPFNQTRETWVLFKDGWREVEGIVKFLHFLEEAHKFRFDLK